MFQVQPAPRLLVSSRIGSYSQWLVLTVLLVVPGQAQNPPPILTSTSPTSVTQNHLINLDLKGSAFLPGDTVVWSQPTASAPTIFVFTPTSITATDITINLNDHPAAISIVETCTLYVQQSQAN